MGGAEREWWEADDDGVSKLPTTSILDEAISDPSASTQPRSNSLSWNDARRNSETPSSRKPSMAGIRTGSLGGPFGAGVVFERGSSPTSPPNDDEVIIVTVRVSSTFRKISVGQATCSDLPERPPQRGFMRRMSTRWHGPIDEDNFKAIKMPRRDYKRCFARDRDGNYAGSEPERQWDEQDLLREFGRYQDLPLRSILC